MTTPTPLDASAIGALYGRSSRIKPIRWAQSYAKPTELAIVFALAFFVALFVCNGLNGQLFGPTTSSWAFTAGGASAADVKLPFLLDPAGLVILVTTLLAPFFCAQQVKSINSFVQDIQANLGNARLASLGTQLVDVNKYATTANSWFRAAGSILGSLLTLAAATTSAIGLYWYIAHRGVLASWNPTDVSRQDWRRFVYDGWWANWGRYHATVVVLICAATYFFYHLYKQLFMGAVFVVYVRRSLRKEFGVAPNLAFDCDGFNGLRPLRYFIMWTWGSTVADFFLTLAVLVVWLPFGLFTVYVEVVLTLLDIFFALYPVALAVGGIILERKRFVQDIQRSPTLSDEKKATRIAGVWATSPLPFRLRSVFSVLVIYLILPAVLAVLSAVLKS